MAEEIEETTGRDGNKAALQPQADKQLSLDIGPPKTWPIVLTGSLLSGVAIGGVYTIIRVASVFEEMTAIATFIAGSTVGLFTLLAVIAQAAIYWQQRNFMMRQWKAMRDSVNRTDTIIDKMQGQMDAMTDQATLIRQQLELAVASECAYLHLRDWETPKFENGFLILKARFLNGGRTPAWEIQGHTRLGVDHEPGRPGFPPIPSAEEEALLDTQPFLFIAANEDVPLPFTPLMVTDTQTRLVEEGRMRIFVDGVCRYLDNLGRRHFYTYGFTVDLPPGGVHPRYERHRCVKADDEDPS